MSRRIAGLVAAIAFVATVPVMAQTAISPPRYQWTAVPCSTWPCAMAAMALANGDPMVIVLPTQSGANPWIVLKRVEIGAIDGTQDSTFVVEFFTSMVDASVRFDTIDPILVPLFVTTVDGGRVVVFLSKPPAPKRRAVGAR